MPEHLRILVLAGVLHDILEDTPTTDEELRREFGIEVARIVRALSHKEEEEADEVYLSRVANGGRLAVLVKRFDRLDNIRSLAKAPANFRARKLAEIRSALPLWYLIDPEGAREIEKEISHEQTP
jgi:(p)ppGpp synthase/HD superfamily hydrolase